MASALSEIISPNSTMIVAKVRASKKLRF